MNYIESSYLFVIGSILIAIVKNFIFHLYSNKRQITLNKKYKSNFVDNLY